MKRAFFGTDEHVHRRQFLCSLGLVGATAVGLEALNPSEAFAFTVKELETGLHEVGGSSVKSNIAIGSALASNTTGEANTTLGAFSLQNNTTGEWNSAVGVEALGMNKIGNGSVALGGFALQNNRNGNYNTAVGYEALQLNNKLEGGGNENVAVGKAALRNNNKGDYNVAVGCNALHASSEAVEMLLSGFRRWNALKGTKNWGLGKRVKRTQQ
jgi:hypothetical protein